MAGSCRTMASLPVKFHTKGTSSKRDLHRVGTKLTATLLRYWSTALPFYPLENPAAYSQMRSLHIPSRISPPMPNLKLKLVEPLETAFLKYVSTRICVLRALDCLYLGCRRQDLNSCNCKTGSSEGVTPERSMVILSMSAARG